MQDKNYGWPGTHLTFICNFVKTIVTFPDLIIISWDDNLAEVSIPCLE